MTLWFSPCSSCWPDSKQASNFLSYLMMHQRLFHFSFSVESRDHPVFHYSGWNIDTNPQHPVRLGVLSCPCTFMFWPALMPLVWLRKCCADARWPSDLCLLLMLRKAFFGLVFFFSSFWVCCFFFLFWHWCSYVSMWHVNGRFQLQWYRPTGRNNASCLIKLKSYLFVTGSSSSCSLALWLGVSLQR